MGKLTATTTVTTEVKLQPTLKRKLLTELRAYAELKAQKAAIEHAMDVHKGSIQKLRESTGEKALALEGFKVRLVEPTRTSLDEKKLVELGCAVAWIQEAKATKPTKAYEKVTCPGEKEEE